MKEKKTALVVFLPFAKRDQLRKKSVQELKALWDRYDGSNAPDGFDGEDIHAELNRRGEGLYCAV